MESVMVKSDTKFYIRVSATGVAHKCMMRWWIYQKKLFNHHQVKCSNCGEETPKGTWIYVDPHEEAELTGSRGTANLVMKVREWKG